MPQVTIRVTSGIKFYDDGAPVPAMAPFNANFDTVPRLGDKIKLTSAQVPNAARAALQVGAPLDEAGQPWLHVSALAAYHDISNPLLPKVELFCNWPTNLPEFIV